MALDLHRKYIEKRQDSEPLQVSTKDIINSKYCLDPLELLGERSFNEPREVDESEIGSPIQEFFRDGVVFLTGGTGFMGKVLVEKLLRTCPHIKHIYLLIRSKKGKNVDERLEDIFEDRLFKRLKYEVPKYYHKVSGIAGDCSLPGLGLSVSSRNTLIKEVNIIFHGAATVRFDEHIRVAMDINVSGTREMMNLAKTITNLKVIAHISTAFSNCNRLHVDEKFYDPIADYKDVLKLVSSTDDQTLHGMTSKILGDLPNTYSFTKSLAEDAIRREAQDLPILVFRPTVVVGTYREPVRGWIDNVYGPTGIVVGACTGVLHTYFLDSNFVTDIIPVDIVVNALICAAKETATANVKHDEIPIYTCSSSIQKPIKWKELMELNKRYGIQWPTIRAIWYSSFWVTKNPYLYAMLNFFCHVVPGYTLDTFARLSGKKPILMNIYNKIDKVSDILAYFTGKEWTFPNNRLLALWDTLDGRDKELFNFDIHQLSWDYFCQAYCLGLRVYLVKDDIHTLPAARKKWEKLYIAHNILLIFVYGIVLCCLWLIVCIPLKLTGLT
ncbi:fatty acyl-CoA reductase wat [Acyrthosiphon pisum]|uniref:Fatty acyl-CoA reductase n=1 Tax=Acyrthosiphon pisum TaxID=7029 RepID=A0A8R1W2M8_ACYPI|nr:fatty acyl-CoA reductase wat [Acyrthosiphon pisum]|eukprot:XP_001946873.2 PREDICTED: putative fatty acyl-CoA reductase CG5065 [Acyrthosiphon pisum]